MTARPISRPAHFLARLTRLAALAAAAALVLAGCTLSRPSPVKQTFLLEPAPVAAAARTHAGSLRVGMINVAGPFRGKALVVRESDLQYAGDFYHEFIVAPSAMIGEATARALGQAGVFTRVIPPGTAADADWILDGFVSALYADGRDRGNPAAVLTVTFYLTRADALPAVPFWSREYTRRAPMASLDPRVHAAALNTALGEVLGELARDLTEADLKK